MYLKTRDSISSPIDSITITFPKAPKTALTMSGYLSPFEGIIHETIGKEITSLMVSPNKLVIDMKKETPTNEKFKSRLKNLLIQNYNKAYSNCKRDQQKASSSREA